MANIIKIYQDRKEKFCITLEVIEKEFKFLNGNIKDIVVFSKSNLNFKTKLMQKGKRDSSKYFLLPKELRKELMPYKSIIANRIKINEGYVYIYFVPFMKIINKVSYKNNIT